MNGNKIFAPSADRNKQPILDVLKKYLIRRDEHNQKQISLLEISSGTGQHALFLGSNMPHVIFQPSELSDENILSIQEYVGESQLKNILPPLKIDVKDPPANWSLPQQKYDVILNINMIHITPWECSVALMQNSSELLLKNGFLITYGPYAVNGIITPESNRNFDKSLKERNAEWGLRDIEELEKVAKRFSLSLKAIEDMPSNNKILVWQKM